MSARVVPLLVVAFVCAAAASGARADEKKVYRWVGQDGHVYTSNSPPPDGKGLIDAPAPKPAAAPAPKRGILASPPPAAPARSAPEVSPADGSECARFDGYVTSWR